MDFDTAELISYGIFLGGLMVWLAGLLFLIRSGRYRSIHSGMRDEADIEPGNLEKDIHPESIEIEGRSADLISRASAVLAGNPTGTLGWVRITEQTQDRLTFERSRGFGSGILRGKIFMQPQGLHRTRIGYHLQFSGKPMLLWAGYLFLFLGLATLVVGFWILKTLVINHPNPTVRWQVLQGLQVIHFLWPPFLFGGIYRKTLQTTRHQLEALIQNLPYHPE